jgi:hypothetical protein
MDSKATPIFTINWPINSIVIILKKRFRVIFVLARPLFSCAIEDVRELLCNKIKTWETLVAKDFNARLNILTPLLYL